MSCTPAVSPSPFPVSAALPAICARYGVSRAWLYERMRDTADDPFPAPVKLGARSVWVIAECDAWFARRAAERDTAAARGREIATAAGTRSAAARRARRAAADATA